MIPERLPWHDSQWLRIERGVRSGRVPHALLLRGASGRGKAMFAGRLAAMLLCGSSVAPCGECASCRLCAAGSHPDRIDVGLLPERREIVVDQVRALIDTVALTARFGRWKVVLVNPAEAMNRHAANTLLKTLEEPPGAAVLILISSNHARLLPTIRSRCQMIDFPVPDTTIALEWLRGRVPKPEAALALARGAPIGAVEMTDDGLLAVRSTLDRDLDEILADGDPMTVAGRWKELGRETVTRWLVDILAERLRRSARSGADRVGRSGAVLHFSRLLSILDRCLEIRGGVLARSGANEQLALERLALDIALEATGDVRRVGS